MTAKSKAIERSGLFGLSLRPVFGRDLTVPGKYSGGNSSPFNVNLGLGVQSDWAAPGSLAGSAMPLANWTSFVMFEQRRLRFSCILGLRREDLPVAAEVWLDEMKRQTWVSPDVLKLAIHFVRYLKNPDADMLLYRNIEGSCRIDSKQVSNSLHVLKVYGVLDGYACDSDGVYASLHLSYLQRLRVLDMRHRFSILMSRKITSTLPWHQTSEQWIPEPIIVAEEDEPELNDLEHADAE